MMPMREAIWRMASTVPFTAAPESRACWADLEAMSSVILAFSAFWATVEEISSTDEEVSSTFAACSVAPWERDWEALEICSEADAIESDELRILAATSRNRSTIWRREWSRLDWSPGFTVTSMERSPAATLRTRSAASLGSPPSWRVIERVTRSPIPKATRMATAMAPESVVDAFSEDSRA